MHKATYMEKNDWILLFLKRIEQPPHVSGTQLVNVHVVPARRAFRLAGIGFI